VGQSLGFAGRRESPATRRCATCSRAAGERWLAVARWGNLALLTACKDPTPVCPNMCRQSPKTFNM
jgi:hypothetical protein